MTCSCGTCATSAVCSCAPVIACTPLFLSTSYQNNYEENTTLIGYIDITLKDSVAIPRQSWFERYFTPEQSAEKMPLNAFLQLVTPIYCELGFKKVVNVTLDRDSDVVGPDAFPGDDTLDLAKDRVMQILSQPLGGKDKPFKRIELHCITRTNSFHFGLQCTYKALHNTKEYPVEIRLFATPNEFFRHPLESDEEYDQRMESIQDRFYNSDKLRYQFEHSRIQDLIPEIQMLNEKFKSIFADSFSSSKYYIEDFDAEVNWDQNGWLDSDLLNEV